MSTQYRMATIGLAFVIAAGAATVTAQSGYDLFQKALAAERADGNLQQAIQLYSRVVKEFGRDRSLAAKALLRMAECFEKLGDAEARALYERVVREYADQPDAVNIARARVNQRLVRPARGERVVWGPGREVDLFGTISPDGRYLTYVDWFGAVNVVLRDLQTGMARPLTPNVSSLQYGEAGWSVISRTGDQVAYDWSSPEWDNELRIAGLDGQGVPAFRRLLSSKGDGFRPFDWSPDGNWIALAIEREDRSSQIGVVNTRSGDLRVLKSIDWRGTGKIVFSPDGRYIAYDLLEGEGVRTQRVLVMAVDGSREVAITSDQGKNHVMGWATDGRLLFASDRSGTMALWAVRVEDGRPAGAPALIKAEIASTWSLGLTRNGALYIWKIAGAMYVSTAPIDLAKGELGRPSEATHFVESRGQPAWSADGRDLLYVSCGPTGAGPCRIVLRNEQTGVSREVPHRLGYAFFPRLSPDGSTILTEGTDLKGRRGIYLIDVSSGATTLVADQPRRRAEWSSNGRAIHYFNRGPDEPTVLLRRELGSDTETEVFRTSACNDFRLFRPFRLSPDGRFIGCTAFDRTAKTTTLMAVPLDGSTPTAVMRANGQDYFLPWQWTPDSQAMLVQKIVPAGADELWLAPLAGVPRRLNIDVRNWTEQAFDLSPDGRQIAFVASAGGVGAEVSVLENFLPPGTEGSR